MDESFEELRIHGVAGTPADDLLATDPVISERRADDRIRVYSPAQVDEWARAYSWCSLTSGSPGTAAWILLLPYLLLNVAGWALPPMPRAAQRAAVALIRVAGLMLTAIFTLLTVDGVSRLVTGWGDRNPLSRLPDEWLVILAGALAVLTIRFLWFATSRPRRPSPDPPPEDPAGRVSFDRPEVWTLDVRRPALHHHTGAALVVIAATVQVAIAGSGERAIADPAGVGLLIGLPLVLVGAAVLAPTRLVASRVGLALAVASLILAWLEAGTGGVQCVSACAISGPLQVVVAGYAVAGIAVLALAAVIARNRSSLATTPALLALAGSTGTSVGAAAVAVAGTFAGVGNQGEFEQLAQAFLAGTSLVAASAMVLFAGGGRPETAAPPVDPQRSCERSLLRVATIRGVRAVRDQVTVVLWVLVVVTAVLAFAALADDVIPRPPLPAITAFGVGVSLVVGLGWLATRGGRAWWALTGLAAVAAGVGAVASGLVGQVSLLGITVNLADFGELAVAVTLLLPLLWLLTRLSAAFRSRRQRKGLAVLWDVGSFFPRWFHPFAPPSYGHVVVPDLQQRLREGTEEGRRLLVAGHSQGSVIAAAALATSLHPLPVALLTFGSPLGPLYARHFPAHFDEEWFGRLAHRLGGRWINLHRDTDPIAGEIPVADDRPLADPCHRIHGGYWLEPEYATAAAELLEGSGTPAAALPSRYEEMK